MTVCQLSYLPLFTGAVFEQVDEVIDMIQKYDVQYEVHDLSTTVKGDKKEIFHLIEDIYNTMDGQGNQFRLHLELLSPQK